MTYIIGSGWFSDTSKKTKNGRETYTIQQRVGGTACRCAEFSKTWLNYLTKIAPSSMIMKRIIIIDSNSPDPISEDVSSSPLVEIVNMTENFEHGAVCVKSGTLCGWARSVILSASYAMLNDVEYFVYVEQDVLVGGEGWLDAIVNTMKQYNKGIALGSGKNTPQEIQQSLIVVSRAFLPTFISRLVNEKDHTVSEESKYFRLFKHDICMIPFHGGRAPYDKSAKHAYAQHMNSEQLDQFIKDFPFS